MWARNRRRSEILVDSGGVAMTHIVPCGASVCIPGVDAGILEPLRQSIMKRVRCCMSAVRACPVTLTGSVRRELGRRARGQKTPHRDKVRAQIVLAAARRDSNVEIAAELRVPVDTVRTWRGR